MEVYTIHFLSSLFYAVTQSALNIVKQFWWSFSAICSDICELIYCHVNAKTLFTFLWWEFWFKSFLELHVHFKDFMRIRMRKLQEERQVPADAHDWCQIVFSFNVPKFVSKYLTTKQLSQIFGYRLELWPSIHEVCTDPAHI